jgi:hypothetical protein
MVAMQHEAPVAAFEVVGGTIGAVLVLAVNCGEV